MFGFYWIIREMFMENSHYPYTVCFELMNLSLHEDLYEYNNQADLICNSCKNLEL
jgi:hypothetical protein